MLVVERVARIRREFFVKGKPIKEIVRDLGVSRNTVAGHTDGDRQMVGILATMLTDGLDAVEAACAEASDVAGRFIDLVFVPQQMGALIGDDRACLDQDASRRIDDAIDLFDHAGSLSSFETPSDSHLPPH